VPPHATPHAPQFALSVPRSTQALLQTVCEAGHVQAPPLHAEPVTVHAIPQPLQFAPSVFVSTHFPLQATCVPGHVHLLATHEAPVAHLFPHVPQLSESPATSTHVVSQSSFAPHAIEH
jgi:hypothetical protein